MPFTKERFRRRRFAFGLFLMLLLLFTACGKGNPPAALPDYTAVCKLPSGAPEMAQLLSFTDFSQITESLHSDVYYECGKSGWLTGNAESYPAAGVFLNLPVKSQDTVCTLDSIKTADGEIQVMVSAVTPDVCAAETAVWQIVAPLPGSGNVVLYVNGERNNLSASAA